MLPAAYSKSTCGCAASSAFREKLSHHLLDVQLKHRMQSAHARAIPAIRASDAVGR
jgi:hypothetical protein